MEVATQAAGKAASHAPAASGVRAAARRGPRRRRPAFHSRYVLLEKLGKGSFGSVYLTARASTTSGGAADLATKVLDLRAQKGKQSTVEKEAAMMRRVACTEHCVKIVSFHVVDGLGYIVMERCHCSLFVALKGMHMLTEGSLVRMFGEMMLSLRGVHAAGVVHRDVQGANFMCSGASLTVKLCDFGLSEVEPAARPGRPVPSLKGVFGTPPFMSPEMVQRTGYNRKTDVWSLGVLMYVIALGRFPYVGACPSSGAMRAAIAEGQPPPSFELEASIDLGRGHPISNGCKDLVRQLLCRDQHSRPEAAEALRHEWYSEDAQRSTLPLRLSLLSAKRAGAFGSDKSPGEDPMDCLIRERQSSCQVAPIAKLQGATPRRRS